ncbi:hypothetical protein C8F04DRAFT_281210 [Mycena alexandri]|uniref:Glucose receptor Git3 N-terminal domain-containing protein n=1 Tax=Mycena alexandri TaxID=1745969 RepID=A0AAD6T5R4_9AGAR|nr:hypothetical protein C8F04DRAFT_281210 [Mycena alexandri]
MATDVSPLSSVYSAAERNTVIILVATALISLAGLLVLLGLMVFMSNKYSHTHFQAYFVCLLLANTMQAWGNTMSLKWVENHGVYDGSFCAAQGGLNQGGNLGAAVWSFAISLHLFNLLFLRFKTPKMVSRALIVFGWCFIFSIVFIGPVAVETTARGHFFGISDLWCSITPAYRTEHIFLEYFFQFISVVANLFLHTATLLRVRGNLLRVEGRWRLRFLPLGDSWQLSLGRDFTDSAMLRLVQHMVWYPVAFGVTIIPTGIVHLATFCGMEATLPIQAVAGSIFNLGGFVNVVLFLGARRWFPEPGAIPEFTAQRQRKDVDGIVARHGVTPFTLQRSLTDSEAEAEKENEDAAYARVSSRRRAALS